MLDRGWSSRPVDRTRYGMYTWSDHARISSQSDDDADAREGADFGVEVRKTVADFLGRRLVVRRRAPHCRR